MPPPPPPPPQNTSISAGTASIETCITTNQIIRNTLVSQDIVSQTGNFTQGAILNGAVLTGEIQVDGVAYFNNTLNVDGQMKVTNDTQIDGKLIVGGEVNFMGGVSVGDSTIDGDCNISGQLSVDGTSVIKNTSDSISKDTGCLVLKGGMGIEKNVYCNGTISTSEIACLSDAKFKKDITPIKNVNKIIDSLQPMQYKFISNDKLRYGLIAQEVKKKGLDNLIVEFEDHLSINYIDIIPLLLSSIKDLKKDIKKLNTRIKKLESGKE